MKSLLSCVAAAGLAAVVPAHAASEWHVTPYLWAAGFDGAIGTPGGDAGLGDRVSIDFGKLAENLAARGAMLNLSWRSDRWTAFGDWTYVKVKSDAPTGIPFPYTGVEGEIRGNILQAFAGYDFARQPRANLDVFGGVRYYDLDARVTLKGNVVRDRSLAGNESWADAVVGVRWTSRFAERWSAYVQGDIGAGGSDFSWQAIAAIGYDFGAGSVIGGWRHLVADYEKGSYRLDAALSGPLLGLSFRF